MTRRWNEGIEKYSVLSCGRANRVAMSFRVAWSPSTITKAVGSLSDPDTDTSWASLDDWMVAAMFLASSYEDNSLEAIVKTWI